MKYGLRCELDSSSLWEGPLACFRENGNEPLLLKMAEHSLAEVNPLFEPGYIILWHDAWKPE
jgi:hypothetical protein